MAEAAAVLTQELLAQLPRRLSHVAAVAERAASVSTTLELDSVLVESAAWLHDIGYASALTKTGLHSLDGALFLRNYGVDPAIANLVAHHSQAVIEAQERGLERELLSEFPQDDALPHDVLCFCDMTTGPDGQQMPVVDRLAEIRARYSPDHVVTRFISRAEPEIFATVRAVEAKLEAVAQSR